MALNCLLFEKIAVLYFGDRQTNKPTNRWTGPLHEADLAVASGGLKIHYPHHAYNVFNLAATAIILHIRELQKGDKLKITVTVTMSTVVNTNLQHWH